MPPNILDHFYRGGERIAALRGVPFPSPQRPEEWLAATVHRYGEPAVGRSRLGDGSWFATLVEADHLAWTGSAQGAPGAGPADVGILVKLLDPAQRLPVHVHPTREFARRQLHSCYGKTEAWYVLECDDDDPAVWIGFTHDVDPEVLAEKVAAQDSEWLLGRMNKINVQPGDGILVPAGEAHATGAGVFVVEVQEPTDFSILVEWWVTTAAQDESYLGLGAGPAFQALNHRAMSPTELDHLRRRLGRQPRGAALINALPAAADPFFRVDLAAAADGEQVGVPHGFAVVAVTEGPGMITATDSGVTQPIARGEVYAVPDAFGDWTVSGQARVVVCRPSTDWPSV